MKPEELTIKQLLNQLKIGQIVAIITAFVTILGAVCSFSYFAGTWVKESQIASLQLRVDGLLLDVELSEKKAKELTIQVEEAKRELEDVSFKEIFMSLYINYIKEVERRKTPPLPDIGSESVQSSDARNDLTSKVSKDSIYLTKFAKFVEKLVDDKEVTLKKGGPGQESIVIFKDGTQWDVPSEVMDGTQYLRRAEIDRRSSFWDEGK